MRKRSIWILYSGYGNVGDEAILWGTLNVFKNVIDAEKIKLIDVYPKMPKKLNSLSVEYINMERLLGSKLSRVLRHTYSAFQLAFSCQRRKAELTGLLWHRGCSCYDSYHGSKLLVESIVYTSTVASRFLYRALGGLSMGFTRNCFERNILKKFLSKWNLILLREPYSLHYIQDLVPNKDKVLLVHDFAIHVNRSESERSKRIKEVLKCLKKGNLTSVILRDYYYQCHYPKLYRVRYFHFIKDLINTLTERGHEVVFIPLGYLGDRENDIRFYQELETRKVLKKGAHILAEVVTLTPSEVVDVLSIFDYVVSVRTHGLILASIANVPTLHLYYEHKGKGIAEHTFGVESWSLYSCLREDGAAEKVVKYLENMADKPIHKILRARKYNEKIVREITLKN